MIRIGQGEDIHMLVNKRALILGGVKIPYEKGLFGHSDADVVYHALADALLGSLALGDIGTYFSPDDPLSKDLNSAIIVKKCFSLVKEKGYFINNVDINIIAEEPKLAPYILEMRTNIASLLECKVSQISIKALTNEGMDAIGEKKAICARASLLISN